jgi:hypothetical protein
MEICDLFNETVSPLDVGKYIDRVYGTLETQANCIEKELGVIARVKFLDRVGTSKRIYDKAKGHMEYHNVLLDINRIKDNP